MACGTPVLAFRNGSVQEIVEDGVTGHVVDTIEEAICRIGAVMALDRARIRRRFEERFTARRMALDYLDVYRQITALKDEAGIVADQLPLASAAE
jgi:glycosyltransferase involved in cell wall biosynthesis